MHKVYSVFATDQCYVELSCVGSFMSKAEAGKCLEWWEDNGDWDNYYIQEYDVLTEFDPSVYG